MPIKKKPKRLSSDEWIKERTRDLRHAHHQQLNEIAFAPRYQAAVNTKEDRRALPFSKWLTANIPVNQRLQLPWSLDYFRLQVANAVAEAVRCSYCGDLITTRNFSLDHKVPVSRREEFKKALDDFYVLPTGTLFENDVMSDEWRLLLCAYAWENIAICCINCNKRKGEMTVADWNILRSALGLMTEVSKRYVWKKLLLSEHTMQAFIMRQKMIAARSGAQKAAVQDDDPNW
jgi:5-methylcytosine-specific restriction endonuclease McrA